jgi:hypothetical protein
MTDDQSVVPESKTNLESLWQYKYGYNSTTESAVMAFSKILAMAEAGKISRLTPVKMVDWPEFKYAQDVPELLEAILPVAWLRFWMYVRLPLGAIFACLAALDGGVISVVINLAFAAWLVVIAIGLHKRKLWAWKNNFIIVFGEPVLWVFSRFQTQDTGAALAGYIAASLLFVGILLGIWSRPNYIYFKKRKSLFQ